MKITDLNTIAQFARQTLELYGSELLEYMTMDEAVKCFTMIYVTNDITTGFAQDYTGNIHVISSPTRIAVIFLGHQSFYKCRENICKYDAIENDMMSIQVAMDAALMRWEEVCV